jgi:hypothetical protein
MRVIDGAMQSVKKQQHDPFRGKLEPNIVIVVF